MHLKNIPIFLLCVQMLLPGAVLAGSGSCIVSGSIARDAAASAVSHHAISLDAVAYANGPSPILATLDAVNADSEVSDGGNLNSLSVGFMFIFR